MEPKNLLNSLSDSVTSFFVRKRKTAVLTPPHLTSAARFPYGPFQFKFQMPKGVGYEIQASTNLQIWGPILAGKSSDEPVDCVDSEASKFNYRFYRVIAEAIPSDNVVGYVTMNAPPGYSLIANPLQAPSNAVSAILPGLPDGAMLNKFDWHLFKLSENEVKHGKWFNPNETLATGEGAIFFNPTSEIKNINFAGEVMQGKLMMPIAAGFSVRSSQIPKPGRLDTDLGFPISAGDVVHLFDRDRQKYTIYEYDPKNWDSNPPLLGVGEAFWIGKTTPSNWVQNLVIS